MRSEIGNCLYTTQGEFLCEKPSAVEHFAEAEQCKFDNVHPLKHAAFAVNASMPKGTLPLTPDDKILKEIKKAINQQCALQPQHTASTNQNAEKDRSLLATNLYTGVVNLSGRNAASLPKQCSDLTNNAFPLWTGSNWANLSKPFDDIRPIMNNNICVKLQSAARGPRR